MGKYFDAMVPVDQLIANNTEHWELSLHSPQPEKKFIKINCWLLEQYSKCVFLNGDCLVLQSIDDLFEREEFSAAPDADWPDCFNSGVFVYRPSKETFNELIGLASLSDFSDDCSFSLSLILIFLLFSLSDEDQDLLNSFFLNWRKGNISRHLPFTYNVTSNDFSFYLSAETR